MALFAKKVSSVEEGIQKSMEAISSGKALEKFLQNVELQGGDAKKLLSQQGKRRSPFKDEIFAARDGFLFVDAYQTGLSCISLGVGRKKSGDKVSADSGIVFKKRSGDFVKKGESILEVYGKDENSLSEGKAELLKAIFIDEKNEKSAQKKIILKEIK
jgi:pyrimidine-nucleoside phosphorylase